MNEEDIKRFMANSLKPQDTFQFECKMCGNCCRKRNEPIILTGVDVFRIAQALNIPPIMVMKEKLRSYLGDSSHIPVLVLKERMDGSCSLLRKGKCMVQANKPIVCAIYPLGRMFNGEKYIYFTQYYNCGPGPKNPNAKVWTLQEWLDTFQIEAADEMSVAWSRMMLGLAKTMVQVPKENIGVELAAAMAMHLYLWYDTTKPFIQQVEYNMIQLQKKLRERYNLIIVYD